MKHLSIRSKLFRLNVQRRENIEDVFEKLLKQLDNINYVGKPTTRKEN